MGVEDESFEVGDGEDAHGEVGVEGGAVGEFAPAVGVVVVDVEGDVVAVGVGGGADHVGGELVADGDMDEGEGELAGFSGGAAYEDAGEGVGAAVAAGALDAGVGVEVQEALFFAGDGDGGGVSGDGVEPESAGDGAVGAGGDAAVALLELVAGAGAVGVGADEEVAPYPEPVDPGSSRWAESARWCWASTRWWWNRCRLLRRMTSTWARDSLPVA